MIVKAHLKRRNPVARSPLLRKGGAHQQPKRGQLQRSAGLEEGLEEWLSERAAVQKRRKNQRR